MPTLRTQLEEIRSALGNQASAEILEKLDAAIASNDDEAMRRVIHDFDSLSTQIIQRMRKTDIAG